MFNQIGGQCGIGAPLSPHQIGGEDFIRHIGNDKLIFDFKEGSGTTIRDKSREGNDGTFGAGATAPTWKRNSLYFDGGDEVILDGINHGISTGEMSLCAFLDVLTGVAGEGCIYDQQNARLLIGRDADKIIFYSGGTGKYLSATGIAVIKPMILQVTRDNSGNLEAYINGKAQGEGQLNAGDVTYNGSSVVSLGANIDPASWIIGTIYSFRILNKCLSGIEAQQIYLSQKFRGNN